jgi:uncharacterized protein (TIGR02145 family)
LTLPAAPTTVATATKLATGRTISTTGDVVYTSPAFDGSANVTAVATLAADAVTTAKILNANVTLDKLAANSVDSTKIVDKGISQADLQDQAVTTAKIRNANVTLAKLAANSVDSTKIVDKGISQADLQDQAVTTAKIRNGNVTLDKLAANSVDSTKIVNGSIKAEDLNNMGATSGQVLKYNGTAWAPATDAGDASTAWQLNGNTTKAGDFIGSINNRPLVFQINGDTVGYVNKTNVAAWGDKALAKNTGAYNTAVGGNVLGVHTTGVGNTAVGYASLYRDTTGTNNTAVGYASQYANTDGINNTAVGMTTLYSNKASDNTAVGFRALYANTDGTYNTAVGDSASRSNTSGSRNTTLGHGAGRNITTGSNNIAIGDSTLFSANNVSNRLNIGNWIYGNAGRIRLGKTDPHASAVLDLNENNTASAGTTSSVGGLALPRIALDTITSQLNGTTPVNGTVVYNTNASMKGGQGFGLYMWSGGSAGKWNSLTTSVLVSSLTFSPSGTLNLFEGSSTTIDVTTVPDNASNPAIKWTTTDPEIVSVTSKGKITAEAVGSATITATTLDGGNKSRSVLVNVHEDGSALDSIGTHQYNVFKFPENLGTWMLSDSKEGAPTATYGANKYYTWAAAPSACPPPYALPDSAQFTNLIIFLRTTKFASATDVFVTSMNADTWAGYVNNYDIAKYYGSRSLWWTSSNYSTNTAWYRYRTQDGTYRSQNTQKNYNLSVRCVKMP